MKIFRDHLLYLTILHRVWPQEISIEPCHIVKVVEHKVYGFLLLPSDIILIMFNGICDHPIT